MLNLNNDNNRNVNLAIRGGGVKSAVGIGVLEVLLENNIGISGISGTSIASIIAAQYASGLSVEKILDFFKKYSTIFSDATFIRGGKGSEVIEIAVNDSCGGNTFRDVDIPVVISANCGGLWKTRPFVFSKTLTPDVTFGEACRASSSFPFLYEHYKLTLYGEKIKFYDGGTVANPAIRFWDGNPTVVASFARESKRKHYSRYSYAWRIPETFADYLIKPNLGNMGMLGTPEDIQFAYEEGKTTTAENIEEIRKLDNLEVVKIFPPFKN